ncbi:hypothetical protein D3C72_1924300 [compost metagenome]
MAQQAGVEIGLAVIGVNQYSIITPRHGVDGEIAPQQILFQCHVRGGVAGKSGVTLAGFTFGAGQRIFLMSLRVEEYREVFTHLLIAKSQQIGRRCADHHPVVIHYR